MSDLAPSLPSAPRAALEIDAAARLSFAGAQNAVALLGRVAIRNISDAALRDLRLTLSARPAFLRAREWRLPDLAPGETLTLADRDAALDLGFFDGLDEAEHGALAFALTAEGAEIVAETRPIELLARDQWGGTSDMPQLLAAFVAPNHPAVAALLRGAAGMLAGQGLPDGLDGYQSGDPRRAWMLTAAIWSAATEAGLVYAEAPKSFETRGQKVRDPGRIMGEGLATCLDTALMLAAAVEAAGLNPVVVFTDGHAFAGAWLSPVGFRSVVEPDVTEVRKAIAARELVLFETTLLCRRPAVGFQAAIDRAVEQVSEAREHEFGMAVDISRCRAAGIRPLASHAAATGADAPHAPATPAPLPAAPDFDMLPGEALDRPPADAQGRIQRWQQKLLDLSLRNKLLNFADSKQTVPLLVPDVASLEDGLSAGRSFSFLSLTDENPLGARDADLHRQRTGEDIERDFAARALDDRRLCARLPERELNARLVTLSRRAGSDMQEGGANTLFLAVGFLKWKKSPGDARSYRAPLLLLPARLARASATAPHRLSHHEDEPRFNATLLQFLERDFDLRVPGLDGDLPEDGSGIDVARVFDMVRHAVRDAPGFEVVEEAAIGAFSFAKFLMWKDLVDRTDQLRRNRLVAHLIDAPETPFIAEGAAGRLPQAADLDRTRKPADLLTPLPADSSQLAAVVAAEEGHDLVIVGPPGTGKSQTIANMIAHCLAHGKTVLFVAEKSAALDVVHRRLRQYGLSDAVLELHSNKSDRKSVLAQLGAAWDRVASADARAWIRVTDDLTVSRDRLNAYVAALHKPGAHGRSVFEGIGAAAAADPGFRLGFPRIDAHDAAGVEAMTALAADLGRAKAAVRGAEALASLGAVEWSFAWAETLLARIEAAAAAARRSQAASHALSAALGLPEDAAASASRLGLLTAYATAARTARAADFRAAFSGEFARFQASLAGLETALAGLRAARAELAAQYPDDEVLRMPLDDLDRDWREAGTKFWPFSALSKRRVRKLMQTYASGGEVTPEQDLAPLRRLRAGLSAVSESPLAAVPGFAGPRTEADALRAWLTDAEALRGAVARLRAAATDAARIGAAVEAMLAPDAHSDEPLRLAAAFAAALETFDAALASYRAHALGAPAYGSLAELTEALEGVARHKDRIGDHARWMDLKGRAEAMGLSPLVEALDRGEVSADAAGPAFLAAYFAWWTPRAMDADPALRGFLVWEHEAERDTFRRLDAEAQGLAAAQIRVRLAHDLPARDSVARRSELGALRHQLGLQRPSMPIRKLLAEMSGSLSKLTPCVLMSPLSVAQYLPADHPGFDMVIFDEASQITTWDAIGAIARGRQSVIVGDPRQLPPTSFFGRAQEDEGVEEYEKDLPSILDEASAAGVPSVQLAWHYRSRDEALIAFSNDRYYGGRLVTFPSPRAEGGGLKLHRVAGEFDRGRTRTNRAEAEAIVAHAVARMTDWLTRPESRRRTLGVITFNIQQQALIQDLLDQARRDAPALEWFFSDARDEPVIVKNIENVQGDERDVMLFSITFGPDASGRMTMNFGALNRDGGEKRLNVAITRAREEMHVFASIGPRDIDLARTRAVGVAHLGQFLDFAERGAAAFAASGAASGAGSGAGEAAESRFEAGVAEALRAKGWEVRTRIGVSGFRIDLGVVHPDQAGAFLAGVECDGGAYRRSAAARDRDQIRETVLRGLGWEILRVWSTDWFRTPDAALQRLDAALTALLDAARARAAEDAAAAALLPPPETVPAVDPDAREDAELFDDADPQAADEAPDALDPDALDPDAPDADPDADADPAIETERDPAPIVDPGLSPERFNDKSYDPVLRDLIARDLAVLSPVGIDRLTRGIARRHGWRRTSSLMQTRILRCIPREQVTREPHGRFVWAPPGPAEDMAWREALDWPPQDRPSAEIRGAIETHRAQLQASGDPALELARLMGVARLSASMRRFLAGYLEENLAP